MFCTPLSRLSKDPPLINNVVSKHFLAKNYIQKNNKASSFETEAKTVNKTNYYRSKIFREDEGKKVYTHLKTTFVYMKCSIVI